MFQILHFCANSGGGEYIALTEENMTSDEAEEEFGISGFKLESIVIVHEHTSSHSLPFEEILRKDS